MVVCCIMADVAAVRLSWREFQITADDLPALLFFR